MVTVNLPLKDDVHARLKALAKERGVSFEQLAAEVLTDAAEVSGGYQLSPEQQAAVIEGMEQIKRGETMTEEEVMAQLRALRR